MRAFRRPGDDPSVFAIELETLARRAFAAVNTSIQLQLVRDRLFAGQAECAPVDISIVWGLILL